MKNILFIVIAVLILLGIGFLMKSNDKPGKLDSFASCLKDKGAVFYGAFWCPHCRDQKQMFGKSAKFLPYVECSTADGQNQLPLCKQKNITGYPTWDFISGTTTQRVGGTVELADLAEKTGCILPEFIK